MSEDLVQSADEELVASALLHDAEFLEELRQQMQKFATLQLGDSHQAEDAVQEALIGALRNARTFGRRAALKTWVFAILKNKIADLLRQRRRYLDTDPASPDDEGPDRSDELFNRRGHWSGDGQPVHWESPEAAVHNQHFWRVFDACLNNLPGRQARVFMMREFIELETHEICTAVDISVSNLNVTLHRARLRLRNCLEKRWFVPEGELR